MLLAKQRRQQEKKRRRWYNQRNGIKAIISHMKNDGWLGRNFLKGSRGSRFNALLAACGQNLRQILRWLAAPLAPPFCALPRLLLLAVFSLHRPFTPAATR